jgi:hypothetical protein
VSAVFAGNSMGVNRVSSSVAKRKITRHTSGGKTGRQRIFMVTWTCPRGMERGPTGIGRGGSNESPC